jgi:hypothetical protein
MSHPQKKKSSHICFMAREQATQAMDMVTEEFRRLQLSTFN